MATRKKSARCESVLTNVQILNNSMSSPGTNIEPSVDLLVSFDENHNSESLKQNDEMPHEEHRVNRPTAARRQQHITAENTEFVIISFEGPDHYSLAGGLGVRVTNLSSTLAALGFPVHLIFVGDPGNTGEEKRCDGNLILHRWCQWISEYYPDGVYHGENEKLYDFNESMPWFVAEHIVKPAAARGKMVAVLGEEWHTTEAICRISDVLHANGLRDRAVIFWNANNTFSFHRINWGRLAYTSTITTVSRYMKQIMWQMGQNPLVVPNGIPGSLLDIINLELVDRLRKNLGADLILSKVARWDPDKRWNMAVGALARLKARGLRTLLLARGGIEPHGEEVMYNARSMGLSVADVRAEGESIEDYIKAIEAHSWADILNVRFHCPQGFLRLIYNASDAVLANSGHEPFGLVGLEAMAAEGIAVTGGTGEDYAVPFYNAIVLETSDPAEIEAYVMYIQEHSAENERIRKAAKQTAGLFTWEAVIKNLIQKLEYQARLQGLLTAPPVTPVFELLPSQDVHPVLWPKKFEPTTVKPETALVGSV
jgi:glycosyltransferase involved in cell wall biosynthesis